MKSTGMFFKKHFFLVTLTPLLILALAACFYRFMVLKDYQITYEASCDPYAHDCFIYCEDDACTDPFYYKYITKHANDLFEICGPDITDCAAAEACVEGQVDCSIDYCFDDPQGCENLTESDRDAQDFFEELQDLSDSV